MHCIDHEDGRRWIYRLMIDGRYQGRGYGRAAMEKLVNHIRELDGPGAIVISIEPENSGAKALYESLGFAVTGRMVDGEVEMVLAGS